MTGPKMFARFVGSKKTADSSKSSKKETESLQSIRSTKPHLILPKSFSQRRASNETYPESSCSGDSSVAESIASDQSPATRQVKRTIKLQTRVDALLASRNYSTKTYPSLETAYCNTTPSPLQQASYNIALQDASPSQLVEMLQAGLSPNPVNALGDSYLHWVCRKGRNDLLQVLLQHGCRLQTCNSTGRTPLHEACWSRQFHADLVETLLRHDPAQLYLQDSKGSLPLAYVRRELRQEWMDFIDTHADTLWPSSSSCRIQENTLLSLPTNSRPIVDPEHSLTLQVAAVVASMTMDPQEAICLQYDKKEDDDVCCGGGDADYPNMILDDSESNFSLGENELSEILTLMSVPASA